MLSEAAPPKSSTSDPDTRTHIAQQFVSDATIRTIRPLGSGNINDTYLVELAGTDPPFVLQRINTEVFPQPHQVMDNLCQFASHAHQRLTQTPFNRRWEVPTVLRTQTGHHHWVDARGNLWRGLSFVPDTTTFNTIQDPDHATEIGYGLGCFHSLLSDLPTARLVDTLPGFHVTPHYLSQYDAVVAQTLSQGRSLSLEEHRCCQLIATYRGRLSILEDAKNEGRLPLRSIHGDPKINNILIDTATGQAVSLIDLDTVKPGLVHYDIGDCLRSSCNPLGEETHQWQAVTFDLELCVAVLQGYLSGASHFLDAIEYDYIYDAIWLITVELGLRFFSDHLAGDIYFKTQRPQHNLQRALVQFQLAESISAQKQAIQSVIAQLKADYCSDAGCAA
ncbi:aminoglycoside phosphotransferase family protein [Leptolyngbya cf. ectocarpi LEGE 11479]|uniref:Aminoglycoside phosphotransferase family protein n=1 Tax=Leptolyngbya cf. ectocarpi LEGE 11479 TaxID=1828722 RepID=A0A928ZT77_LEPEC|nr:aminoglycoside phosphotransferase family protein [Leptolyngbya ectocarpi]MBE9066611.1 aminoglycoside phosphotransferase family protein [Leptolyngbya cf. ectocarpi LEGE 11479]